MVVVNLPLNPLTPDPDFGLCFLAIGEFQSFLVSLFSGELLGNSNVKPLLADYREMTISRVHCCGKLLVNSNFSNVSLVYS